MTGAGLVRADALAIPLADESVDLIVTSPPYFALRSYTDGGEHYEGQLGSEATPDEFLEALWAVTAECMRVLKPGGSMWVNLGDKYAERAGPARPMAWQGDQDHHRYRKAARPRRKATPGIRAKSLMGFPWRYALGCIDQLGLILRAEVIWFKTNGLPESVNDRVRRSHEQWFHLTKEPTYFAEVDEVREEHSPVSVARSGRNRFAEDRSQERVGSPNTVAPGDSCNPLGKLPGSVWSVPSEPLQCPPFFANGRAIGKPCKPDSRKYRAACAELWRYAEKCFANDEPCLVTTVDHFAAFPQEWPRRIILGWSPVGYCTACDQPRRPCVEVESERYRTNGTTGRPKAQDLSGTKNNGHNAAGYPLTRTSASIVGYECGCPEPSAPTRPAVVLDPFGGTGTVAMVARSLGRFGVNLDLSADYVRLARWRVFESGHADKAVARTNSERRADGRRDLVTAPFAGDSLFGAGS